MTVIYRTSPHSRVALVGPRSQVVGPLAAASTAAVAVSGTAVGSLTVSSAATGIPDVTGTAVGSLAVAGVASGVRPMSGTAAGSFTVTGFVAGTVAVTATAVGSLTIAGSVAVAAGQFPTAISGDDHHIVDQDGNPWFMIGDAGWEIGVQLGPADVETYLEDRAAKGFNAILCQLTEIGAFTTNGPNNYNNDPPFTGAAYASSLNEAYWAHWDDIFALGATLGITFLCCPAYQGIGGPSGGEGWYNTIAGVSNTNMQNFGVALGTRYADTPNLIWVAGGDNALDGTMDARWGAFFTGLATTGDTHLRTFHSEPGQSGQATAGGETWFDLNNVYEYGIADTSITDESNSAWTGSPTRPAFFIEGRYEYENSVTRADLRRQIYTSVFGGCFSGFVWGNAPIWYFNGFGGFFAPPSAYDTWQEALDSPGTADVEVAVAFFAGLGDNLHTLTPDTTDTFLTAGEGLGAAAFNTTAAAGVVGLAYRGNGGPATLTFDLTEVDQVGTVTVSKVDPTTGAATVLGTHATTGSQSFGSLGTNSGGDTDWLLVATVAVTADVTGTATGPFTVVGTALGVPDVTGTAAGSLTVAGAASGSGFGAGAGTGVGTITVTGTSSGQVAHTGTAVGSFTVVGTSTGVGAGAGTGTAVGTIGLTGAASGQKTVTAVAVGGLTLSTAAVGQVTVTATAAGSLTVVGVAIGMPEGAAAGTGVGSITLTGTSSGIPGVVGTASGALGVAAAASGVPGHPGTAVGSLVIVGTASGVPAAGPSGQAVGAVTVVGVAVGAPGKRGTAVGTIVIVGAAAIDVWSDVIVNRPYRENGVARPYREGGVARVYRERELADTFRGGP